ncbi:MAG TPA: hypothetical protein EYP68_00060 [Candidatus Korarchaeota archaeon]|nr:hypothetical protein [Candidatus Korarchaeota archaeon]
MVDATGNPGSIARSFFDYSGYRSAPALQCYSNCDKALPEDAINLIILPYGYAWIFPRGDLLNVGVSGFVGIETQRRDLDTLIKRFGLKVVGKIRRAVFSVGGPLPSVKSGKVVVAGEAAGMVMPFTGEGIRYALYSGSICYKPNYQKLWDKKYRSKLRRVTRWLKKILSLPSDLRMRIIKEAPVSLLLSLFQGERPRTNDMLFLLNVLIGSAAKIKRM